MSADVLETLCGGCGRTLRVAPEHAGKMARCPVCSHITLAPELAPLQAASEARTSEQEANPAPLLLGSSAGVGSESAEWYMKTPEEQTFGPASFEELERWVREGRVTADCQLCLGISGQWQRADGLFPSLKPFPPSHPPSTSAYPPNAGQFASPGPHGMAYGGASYAPLAAYAPDRYVVPHRGPLILTLGLLGLFIQCPIFPFMAWVMGSNDLRAMQSGRMDATGRDLTRAGMIIGMILSILWILLFLLVFGAMLTGLATS